MPSRSLFSDLQTAPEARRRSPIVRTHSCRLHRVTGTEQNIDVWVTSLATALQTDCEGATVLCPGVPSK
jgi:hypothetical protein